MRKFFILFTLLVIIVLIIGCVSYKSCYRINIPEDNLSLDFENDPVEIMTNHYTIKITPYYSALPDSDSNENGEFLTQDDVDRGNAEFK